MKGFPLFVLVLGAALVGAWFAYDPYLKPVVDSLFSEQDVADKSRVISSSPSAPVPQTPAPGATSGSQPSAPGTTSSPATTTPNAPTKSDLDLALEKAYPMPEITPLLDLVDQWRNVPPKAFPTEIAASESVPFQLTVGGQVVGSSNIPPGTPLRPLRLVGDQLVVGSPSSPEVTAQIAVDKTDFKSRIETRYQEFVDTKRGEIEKKRKKARQMVEADPARMSAFQGKAEPTAPAQNLNPADADARIAVVKESLRRGDVASVKFEEARSYRWNGIETVEGDFPGTYETVTVNFDVDTEIFGHYSVDYKALLRDGKVHAWIDPYTEDKI